MTITAAPYQRTFLARSINFASPSLRLIELTTPFPCRHFNPASIASQREESTTTGTRAISGSAEIRLINRVMAAGASSIPSSMLTSIICAPLSTCCRATWTAAS